MTLGTAARVPPPLRVEAELVERRMASGRNQPLLVSVRDAEGKAGQCVIKPRTRLLEPPLEYLLEWLGATIARCLGIATPEPFAVTITDDFAASVGAEFRHDLRSSVGLVYGSRYERRYTQLPRDYALSPSQREGAARILAFDVFVHNPDRRADNNNLFVDREGFLVFDHELAFDFVRGVIGAPDPVLDHCPAIVEHHVFRAALRGKSPPMTPFRGALAALDTAFFAELEAAAPPEWTGDRVRGKLDRILEALQKRRDLADSWLPKAFACLDR